MRIRIHGQGEKLQPQVAPMIDVVFQLLLFFMLTLKIVEPEGDYSINMPIGPPTQANPDQIFPDIKVQLVADSNGNLVRVYLGGRDLGGGPDVFKRLNNEILKIIGYPGNPLTKDIEVEIDADYGLRYQYAINAISACLGRLDENGRLIRFVEKIKFAPPRQPE